ncbi:MAG: class B sortase [Lachnospiraceae bacterium]|nr:class B sortase [Lachnospiraceae bacterium]
MKKKQFGLALFAIRGISGLLNIFLLVFLLLIGAYAVYALWDTEQVIEGGSTKNYETFKPLLEEPSLEELERINEDVVGWITVYGTTIDYPVVQGRDNWEYIDKDVMGSYSLTGSLFLDSGNESDFSEYSSIIYGHNMTPQVMFGSIREFLEKDFFDSHEYGSICFGGKLYGLRIFALLHEIQASDSGVYRNHVPEDEEDAYLRELLDRAFYSREAGTPRKIVLLSTCSPKTTNGRNILIAEVTDSVEDDSFAEKEETGTRPLFSADGWSMRDALPDIMWYCIFVILLIAILVVIIRIVRMLIDARNRRMK